MSEIQKQISYILKIIEIERKDRILEEIDRLDAMITRFIENVNIERITDQRFTAIAEILDKCSKTTAKIRKAIDSGNISKAKEYLFKLIKYVNDLQRFIFVVGAEVITQSMPMYIRRKIPVEIPEDIARNSFASKILGELKTKNKIRLKDIPAILNVSEEDIQLLNEAIELLTQKGLVKFFYNPKDGETYITLRTWYNESGERYW